MFHSKPFRFLHEWPTVLGGEGFPSNACGRIEVSQLSKQSVVSDMDVSVVDVDVANVAVHVVWCSIFQCFTEVPFITTSQRVSESRRRRKRESVRC